MTWMLIGLYGAIYIGWDLVHAHVHQEAVESHSVLVEKNPCHRSIFHGELDVHKNHVTAFKNCASCHVVSHPPDFTESFLGLSDYPVILQKATASFYLADQLLISNFSSRAPPFLV